MALFASQNRDWTGPVRSPIDGNLYETRESYLAHINEHAELRWIEEPEKVGRKLAKSVR